MFFYPLLLPFFFFFFFNDTATTEIYTLSLHDALPISPCRRPGCSDYNRLMDHQHLYRLLRPGSQETAARIWRGIHHAMVAAGIGVFLALTVVEWRQAHGRALSSVFFVVAAFFVLEYLLRLYAAAGAPGGEHR